MIDLKYVDAPYVRALTLADREAHNNGGEFEELSPEAQCHIDYILRRLVHEVDHTKFQDVYGQRYLVHFCLGNVDNEVFNEIAKEMVKRGFYIHLDHMDEETVFMTQCAHFTVGW